jgi:hypothetical protein
MAGKMNIDFFKRTEDKIRHERQRLTKLDREIHREQEYNST